MQGLADGYFVIPYTIGNFLSTQIRTPKIDTNQKEFADAEKEVVDRINRLMSIKGTLSVDDLHKRLGKVMWDECGMSRSEEGLRKARREIAQIKEDFWKHLRIPGDSKSFNPELDKAGRVADFIELGQLMVEDALHRLESCGGHFREEYQTPDGETLRDDQNFKYVAAWEYMGEGLDPQLHKEDLIYEEVEIKDRSYK